MFVTVEMEKVHKSDGQTLFGEASTMGLEVGEWPMFIALLTKQDGTSAEGVLFQKGHQLRLGGGFDAEMEFLGMVYYSKTGWALTVWND